MILEIPGGTERRRSPRFVLKQTADIVLADGANYAVETRNISSAGLQVICDTWVTEQIEPRGIQSHKATHLRFKVVLPLKFDNETKAEPKKVYANCRVMSAQRLSQDEYMLNIAILSFDNATDVIYSEFLEQFTQKKTVISATG